MKMKSALLAAALVTACASHAVAPNAGRPLLLGSGLATPPAAGIGTTTARVLPTAVANGNTAPAGMLRRGVLSLRLVAQQVRWHPEADDGPSVEVEAFGEEGQAPSIPGPLLRGRVGTVLDVSVRNSLPDTLLVFGIGGPAGAVDTLRIPPGGEVRSRRKLTTAGTYGYGGATIVGDSVHLLGSGNQLLGALIVDHADAQPDRVLVISVWPPTPGQFVMAINGKSWPYTERMDVTVGDSVTWRVINGTRGRHPMHLHGFYFRIDSRGTWSADTAMADAKPMVVTESVPYRGTYSMTWAVERAGNWLFHCHDALHTTWRRRFNLTGERPPPTLPMNHEVGHAEQDMSGLVIGIRARNRDGSAAIAVIPPAEDFVRVAVVEKAGYYAPEPGFSYVQLTGTGSPVASLEIPARPLVLRRGVPAQITVLNRMSVATAVHWHGIELESFHDGVAGWSGDGITTAPVIAPQDSFIVRMTPPRAGTFIFHAHVDDMRQMALGLYGPLIVLPPGGQFDPSRDHVFLVSQMGRGPTAGMGVNGSATPAPMSIDAGVPHRMRFINISIQHDATFTLFSDSSMMSWRAIAKDGADLPPGRAVTGPARLVIAPGETYDFEVTLKPGAHRMAVESNEDVEILINALALAQDAATPNRSVPGRIAFTRVREDVTQPGDYRLEAEIWVMNGDGTDARRLTFNTSDDFGIAWSPDGSRLVFGANQFIPDSSGALVPAHHSLYVIDPADGTPTRITPVGLKTQFPSWSPDGTRILFHGSRQGSAGINDIFVMDADGSNIAQLTSTDAAVDARPEWSPDGRHIAFQSNRDGSNEIHVMNADGSDVIQLTHGGPGTTNMAPAWSPDGKRLLFQSNRDGNVEVYVMNPDGSGQTRLTHDPAPDGDAEWADDGRLIVFDRDVPSGRKMVPQLWVMNADGTAVSPLTGLPSSNSHAAWTGTTGCAGTSTCPRHSKRH
ncbi:MAG: PD40 domain-containing protein [Gemmatimonadales bacterium]|nr:PD40 domain-containing protein [Gemmatimonadales bacterium]